MRFFRDGLAVAALMAMPSMVLAAPPTIGGCPAFPATNYWNTPIDALPVHESSGLWVQSIGRTTRLHPDWGNVLADNFGIPFTTVGAGQPKVPINPYAPGSGFESYPDESDPGPYPIPPDAPIEGGAASTGDRHVIVVDTADCMLYELFNARSVSGGASWNASSWAKYNLNVNAPLRPAGWTSADAAGLPIFPGLVRWEEVAAGEIAHAIRFTAASIWGRDASTGQPKYLWPARHWSGSSTDPARPPMGARFRLKASFDISGFSAPTQVILRAFKKYGLVLADAGSNWFFSGVSSASWPDAVLDELKSIEGGNFEAVDTSPMMLDPDSGEALLRTFADVGRVSNVSTRMRVGTVDEVLIAGFVIGGAAAKNVVVRARGPSLAAFGVANPLANPTLQLVRSADSATLATNDDWQSASNMGAIVASGFAPGHAQEAAILASLAPGAYTAIVSGAGGTTGVGIAEVFEVDTLESPLVNISTRGQVLGGDNVMIGGFVIQGSTSQTVVVRARGPSLAAFGVANPLANPTLQLVRSSDSATLATNDNWGNATNAAAIAASGFAPSNALESAILITLAPGAYTAIVSGVAGGTGVAIVEVFRQ